MRVDIGEGDQGNVSSGLCATGGRSVPLLGVEVSAEVVAGHARATVRQRYKNEESRPIEAIYTFPLPSRAVLTAFSMTVAGRRVEGEVQERERAFKTYDDAVTAGHGAALLEQERPNVFTANVGNLLPGEETVIEVEYVEPVKADEGAVRWSVPTLVAPRYIPGTPTGDRTAHGAADPTDRVPDADRISPPIGAVDYGLSLDLVFDLGVEVDVQCASHDVRVQHEGDAKAHVRFAQREVALDRDVVVTASPRAGTSPSALTPIAGAVAHRRAGAPGAVAITVVPDLAAGLTRRQAAGEVVFVLDRSGSMGGSSMDEARTALRLCLRQLREGDRFNILAFDTEIEVFSSSMVTFTQATLRRADAWLAGVDARGGTEMLQPLLEAARLAPDGVVVLLTDGEVGNEAEIASAFLGARRTARVYSFGIGTNVSDALLVELAERTGGEVERIHPGERVDDKVVTQFARATAPRVTSLTIKARGVDLGELAPAAPTALVDSEPLTLFGRYDEPGSGAIELRGVLDGEPFYLEVPIALPEESERPVLVKLWAQARIRDLERAPVTGRRGEAMRDRIVALAVEHGVSSKYTSFVVVEKRTGDRRANEHAEARVVPVAAPAGWAMFERERAATTRTRAGVLKMPMPARMMSPPSVPAAPAPRPAGAPMFIAREVARDQGSHGGADDFADMEDARFAGFAEEEPSTGASRTLARASGARSAPREVSFEALEMAREESGDDATSLLARQAASGLWEDTGEDTLVTTARALATLATLGLSTSHPKHGAQIKKAVEALLERIDQGAPGPRAALALALASAWLLATGRRTRSAVERAAAQHAPELALGVEADVRRVVGEALASG